MVQIIKKNSWGSRLVGAFWGVLIGITLIIGAFILIFWNEGHGLHVAQSLLEAEKIVTPIAISPIDPKNDQRLVYLSGRATTKETLTDKLLNISQNAIKLDRKVEMYQWEESQDTTTENKLGGGEQEITNYTYKMVWSSKLIDSTNFKEQAGHQNPTKMAISPSIQYAKKVTIGDFTLPHDLVTQIDGATSLDLVGINEKDLKAKTRKTIHNEENSLYLGENPNSPQIGDIRISMFEVLPQMVSVIAQQSGKELQPYLSQSGQEVSLITLGSQSPQKMIADAISANRVMTWIWRAVSALMLIIGCALILNPLAVLADVVPLLGSIIKFGIGLFSLMAGLMLWATATAIAWFTVRPGWAIGLIIIVLAFCFLIFPQRKKT